MFYIDIKKPSTNILSIIIINIINIIVIIDSYLKHVLLNDIIIYNESKIVELLV